MPTQMPAETSHPFWLGKEPLLLASRSAARRELLSGAGIPFEIVSSTLDEESAKRELACAIADPGSLALGLAREKGLAASRIHPGRIVLAGDQTLNLDGVVLGKVGSIVEAADQLRKLRGRWHALHSAVSFCRDGQVLFSTVESAHLKMRAFSDDFLDTYVENAGTALAAAVGCYFYEGEGIHLFEKVEGKFSTILGLPLDPVLNYLRAAGLILA